MDSLPTACKINGLAVCIQTLLTWAEATARALARPVARNSLPCLLLVAVPAMAEPDARALLIDAARDNGCLLTEGTVELALRPLGVTGEALVATVEAMRAAGELDRAVGMLSLSAQLCEGVKRAAVPSITPLMARVIAVFRENGCRMEMAAGMAALEAAGIGKEEAERLGAESDGLAAAGLMVADEATRAITVREPLCSSPVVMQDPSEPLIRMLRDNGCILSPEDVGLRLAEYGLTMETADAMAAWLIDEGLARIEGGRFLVLDRCEG